MLTVIVHAPYLQRAAAHTAQPVVVGIETQILNRPIMRIYFYYIAEERLAIKLAYYFNQQMYSTHVIAYSSVYLYRAIGATKSKGRIRFCYPRLDPCNSRNWSTESTGDILDFLPGLQVPYNNLGIIACRNMSNVATINDKSSPPLSSISPPSLIARAFTFLE